MTFGHKFNHKIWCYNRWYDTQNTPSYLGVLVGTYYKTIKLTHNIINPVISTKILTIKEYDTLQINILTNTNTTRTQHEDFLQNKEWNSGTNPAYVEPLPIPLIKETCNGKPEKYLLR